MKTQNQTGFTLFETLIVTALSAIVVLIGALVMSSSVNRNDLVNVSTDVVDTLRRAEWHTMNGKQNDVWGVHFTPHDFTLYRGATYVAGAPENVITTVPNSTTLSQIIIQGGGSDVLFNSSLGNTSNAATITVELNETAEKKTILVNPVGAITRN